MASSTRASCASSAPAMRSSARPSSSAKMKLRRDGEERVVRARRAEQVVERLHDQCAQRGGQLLHRVAAARDRCATRRPARARRGRWAPTPWSTGCRWRRRSGRRPRAPGRTPRGTRGSGARRDARSAPVTSSALVGKWCSCAPRDSPARRAISGVVVRAYPRSHRHSSVASRSRARVDAVRSAWVRRARCATA